MTGLRVALGRAGLVATVALACAPRAWSEHVTRHVLMRGTPYETPYYVKVGDDPFGAKICVIGGVHGNEVAGYVAARRIANWRITRGVLIVLPEAHRAAIQRNQRGYPGNMNAMFPGDPGGDAMHRLASEIWHIVDLHRPNLLLTLHESQGFHKREPARYGHTLCHDFKLINPLVQRCIDRANPDIPDQLHRFEIFVEPHPTCPTYCAWSMLRIPATSIETCLDDELSRRVRYQLMMSMAFFDEAGLGYEQLDVPRLSTANRLPLTPPETWGPHFAAVGAGLAPPLHYGILQVGADGAEAKVYVDGYYKGCTPASVALQTVSEGRTVRVTVNPRGAAGWSETVSIFPNVRVRVQAKPAPVAAIEIPPPPSRTALRSLRHVRPLGRRGRLPGPVPRIALRDAKTAL